jgi:phosphatidylserine/phosphatidylglycerophosphate/cardiolipin synthase-like enzyme
MKRQVMKRQTWSVTGVVLLAVLFAGRYFAIPGASAAPESQRDIACYFSPKGGCTEAVVAEIGQARESILVQAYSFTSTPIAKALVEARKRGVQITVILDKSNLTGQYSSADFVLHASIPTYIDDKHAIAHNKIMLIDGRTIITGSFNFTKQAESSNAENLLVIHNHPDLFAQYQTNFKRHLDHSQEYHGRANVESAGLEADGTAEPKTKSTRRRR